MFNKVIIQTAINRYFELGLAKAYKNGKIKSPIYLGIGQEHIAACLFQLCHDYAVFPQHRCHSYGLSWGIPPEELAKEILGRKDGLNQGMGGSASFGDSKRKIFGHSGLLGDQVPIACGYALKHKTLCIMGDAAAEEDYVLASLGFASTQNLPILFICEDNNLSILTEKKVRRNWNIVDVAKAFKLNAIEIDDRPETILNLDIKLPMLININTNRHMWHAGVGIDKPCEHDRFEEMLDTIEGKKSNFDIENIRSRMENIWQTL